MLLKDNEILLGYIKMPEGLTTYKHSNLDLEKNRFGRWENV